VTPNAGCEPRENSSLVGTSDGWLSELGTGHGVGKPYFYVCSDENGGERSWWLDPEQAEHRGRRLLEFGIETRVLNEQEDRRRSRSPDDSPRNATSRRLCGRAEVPLWRGE
jgi:hypothetical protein